MEISELCASEYLVCSPSRECDALVKVCHRHRAFYSSSDKTETELREVRLEAFSIRLLNSNRPRPSHCGSTEPAVIDTL